MGLLLSELCHGDFNKELLIGAVLELSVLVGEGMQGYSSGNKDCSKGFNLNYGSSPSFLTLLPRVVAELCGEGSVLLSEEGELSTFDSFLVKIN